MRSELFLHMLVVFFRGHIKVCLFSFVGMLTAAVSDPEASEQSSRPNPGDCALPGGWYITHMLYIYGQN